MEALRLRSGVAPGARERLSSKLLIVQRNQLTARSLGRYLGRYFGAVSVVCSRSEAEALFHDGSLFTHLVCGDDFGTHELRGCELIVKWRNLHPEIACAVLATGADIRAGSHGVGSAGGVDAIFKKPDEPGRLLSLLGVGN
jgi:DNA-binding NarL/FixJ family response regulator